MNKFLLSVDPSMTNTGFTLWENKKPILILSYSFKKYSWLNFNTKIINKLNYLILDNEIDIIIEKGFLNPKVGRGKSTLDYLRGFIFGQFKQLIEKDMLIYSSAWQSWILKEWNKYFLNDLKKINKWDKKLSIKLAQELINQEYWNITINNHDEAESLLIGYYYLNKI